MLDYTVMDTHDKNLLLKVATMVEDNQRRLTLIEELVRSGGAKKASDAPDKEAKRAEKEKAVEALSASDRALYEALRSWRRDVAASMNRSPMTVCHDQALLDVVHLRPTTEMAMLATNNNLGRKHGPEIIALVKSHPQVEGGGDW